MSEQLINPEVPDRPYNFKNAVKEIMQLCDTFPELGKLIYMKLHVKYGVFNP